MGPSYPRTGPPHTFWALFGAASALLRSDALGTHSSGPYSERTIPDDMSIILRHTTRLPGSVWTGPMQTFTPSYPSR
jgi:hypothetical protein